jgi:hypothetical protein
MHRDKCFGFNPRPSEIALSSASPGTSGSWGSPKNPRKIQTVGDEHEALVPRIIANCGIGRVRLSHFSPMSRLVPIRSERRDPPRRQVHINQEPHLLTC